MDSHDRDHRLLAAFLAGDLDPATARRWDEHLLECEACWRAVREDRAGHQAAQVLRQPAPPGLADRVGFAVEMAAARTAAPRQARPGIRTRRRARHDRRLRWRLAGAGAVAAGLVITLMVLLLPGGRQASGVPAAAAPGGRFAPAVPPPPRGQHSYSGGGAPAGGGGPPAAGARGRAP